MGREMDICVKPKGNDDARAAKTLLFWVDSDELYGIWSDAGLIRDDDGDEEKFPEGICRSLTKENISGVLNGLKNKQDSVKSDIRLLRQRRDAMRETQCQTADAVDEKAEFVESMTSDLADATESLAFITKALEEWSTISTMSANLGLDEDGYELGFIYG